MILHHKQFQISFIKITRLIKNLKNLISLFLNQQFKMTNPVSLHSANNEYTE